MLKHKKLISAVSAAALMLTSAAGLPLTSSLLTDSVITASASVTPINNDPETLQVGDCGSNATYTLDSDGNLVITGTGAIDDWAFYYNSNIKTVIIQNGITSTGESTFSSCRNLETVSLPESLTSIGYSAFPCCESLKSITIPKSVTSIDYGAFYGCNLLETVTIPLDSELVSIGDYAFYGCNRLTDITIPEKVESIGYNAFYMDSNLCAITAVYCHADPALLEWNEGGCDDFKPDRNTNIHVPANCVDEYTAKFANTVNGIFAGNLPNLTVRKHPSKEQTCANDGNIEYYENLASGKLYRTRSGAADELADDLIEASDTVIPADGVSHSWSEWTKDNTTGKVTRTCAYCHETEEYAAESNDPCFIVTIPASIDLDGNGEASAYMDVRYYGVTNEAIIQDNDVNNIKFKNKHVYVHLTAINGVDIKTENIKYTLSDDHEADPVEYELLVKNRDGDLFNPISAPDSAVLRAFLDAGSNWIADDSAILTFRIVDGQNPATGKYKGTLTFTISVEGGTADDIPSDRHDPL